MGDNTIDISLGVDGCTCKTALLLGKMTIDQWISGDFIWFSDPDGNLLFEFGLYTGTSLTWRYFAAKIRTHVDLPLSQPASGRSKEQSPIPAENLESPLNWSLGSREPKSLSWSGQIDHLGCMSIPWACEASLTGWSVAHGQYFRWNLQACEVRNSHWCGCAENCLAMSKDLDVLMKRQLYCDEGTPAADVECNTCIWRPCPCKRITLKSAGEVGSFLKIHLKVFWIFGAKRHASAHCLIRSNLQGISSDDLPTCWHCVQTKTIYIPSYTHVQVFMGHEYRG